jgi:DNA-binding NarL/FixJ family response regulator
VSNSVKLSRPLRWHALPLASDSSTVPETSRAKTPPVEPAGSLATLSVREREVLRLLAAGQCTDTVAERLSISPLTVRNHVRHILGKLGVHRRIDAILLWVRSETQEPSDV